MTRTREEKVRQRAYELYQARGRVAGREQDDWYEAERQVLDGQDEGHIASEGFELDGIDGRELRGRPRVENPRRARSS